MITKRTRCLNKPQARSSRTWQWEPATIWHVRKLEVGDLVSVITETGQRRNGIVVSKPYCGRGVFTSVTIAYDTAIEKFRNTGNQMARVLVPQAPRVLEFLPYATPGGKQRVLATLRGCPFDF